jgi:hypothetical protein
VILGPKGANRSVLHKLRAETWAYAVWVQAVKLLRYFWLVFRLVGGR